MAITFYKLKRMPLVKAMLTGKQPNITDPTGVVFKQNWLAFICLLTSMGLVLAVLESSGIV